MSVVGYDATFVNVRSIPHVADVVMGYDTGSPDILWPSSAWTLFPHSRHVHIDQGGHGSPVLTSTVRDVETGAWDPATAVRNTKGWNVARPTIYCNMNTLPDVMNAGWKGDLWLAIPSDTAPLFPPDEAPAGVVAIQWRFTGAFDQSVVFDFDWPDAANSRPLIQYAAPMALRETATVNVAWLPVPDVDSIPPTGYTVEFFGLDGHLYWHGVTTGLEITATGLNTGWTYQVHVWANGGNIAPPHSAITVHT